MKLELTKDLLMNTLGDAIMLAEDDDGGEAKELRALQKALKNAPK